MSFQLALLIVFNLVAILSAEDTLDKVPSVIKCAAVCSGANKDACTKGCKFAFALTFAQSNHQSCVDSCRDVFSEVAQRDACANGCKNYPEEIQHVSLIGDTGNSAVDDFLRQRVQMMSENMQNIFGGLASNSENSVSVKQDSSDDSFLDRKISDVFQRIRSYFAGSAPSQQSEVASDSDEPVFTRVRILFLSTPDEQSLDDSDKPPMNEAKTALDSSNMFEDQKAEKSLTKMKMIHHEQSSVCHKLLNGVHYVFTKPFSLLLVLTLLVLVVLFITQLVLYLKRQSSRSNGHEYTRLPTYAEAVEIKIPVNAEDYIFGPTDKSKLAGDDAQA